MDTQQKGSVVNAEEKLKFDYEQTHELIRMFTDIRFKLLAFVLTLTGAAVALLSGIDNRATTLILGLDTGCGNVQNETWYLRGHT